MGLEQRSSGMASAGNRRARRQVVSAGLIVVVPFAGLAVAAATLWGHGIGLADVTGLPRAVIVCGVRGGHRTCGTLRR